MTAFLLLGSTAIAVGIFLIASSHRRELRAGSATADLIQRIPTLTISGFTARRTIPSDVQRIIEAMDETFLQSNGWTNKMRRAAVTRLRRTNPDELGYITVCQSDGVTIAWGTVDQVAADQSRCSLGFSLHPSARSRGLGTGALNAVVQAVHQAGIHTIELGTAQANQAMVTCIRNVGATQVREGPARLPNGTEPMALWFEHPADQ